MKKDTTSSPALRFVRHAWDSIPGGSWQRINSSMQATLRLAVESGMKFIPGDLTTISNTMRGNYWMSTEGLYSSACGGDRGTANPSFVAAFEAYCNRKPYLWAEDNKTPTRLYIGARFTWKNEMLEVTSFSKDHFVAVTRGEDRKDVEYEFGDYRVAEMKKTLEDGTILARYSAPIAKENRYIRGTRHVRKITHKELSEARKAFDAKRKAYEKEFMEAATLEAVEAIAQRIIAEGRPAFRHFDIEILRQASQDASRRVQETMTHAEIHHREEEAKRTHDADLVRWMAGEDVRRTFSVVKLRVVGDWVETSTMQRATVKSVRAALLWAAPRRKGWKSDKEAYHLDNFPVRSITRKGCQVGCTFVPWAEIDRITPQIQTTEGRAS